MDPDQRLADRERLPGPTGLGIPLDALGHQVRPQSPHGVAGRRPTTVNHDPGRTFPNARRC
jgi:hypothetical protein